VKYELGFYIPEDDILHSHSREDLKSSPYMPSAFLFTWEAGMEPSPLLLRPFIGLLYQPWVKVVMTVEQLAE
jgi:hypothetical protein